MKELHLVGFIVSLLALHQLQMFETSLLAYYLNVYSLPVYFVIIIV